MNLASQYDWNVEIDVGGVTFDGPGMETRQEAVAIAEIIESSTDDADRVEVVRQ
jgi:hypothetical protein